MRWVCCSSIEVIGDRSRKGLRWGTKGSSGWDVPLRGLCHEWPERNDKPTHGWSLRSHLHLHRQDLRSPPPPHRRNPSPIQEYVKNCLFLVFDAALFYGRSRDHKNTVSDVLNSKEIASLIGTLRNFKDRAGVGDLLAFIEDKLRSQRRWYYPVVYCLSMPYIAIHSKGEMGGGVHLIGADGFGNAFL